MDRIMDAARPVDSIATTASMRVSDESEEEGVLTTGRSSDAAPVGSARSYSTRS